jgi:RNA polymerase sigma factor (sigma-70 family)
MSRLTEDRALLSSFRAGERKAMEAVYLHYAPQLSALVFRGLATQAGRVRVTTPFEVGSVVQETFARSFQEKARIAYDGLSPYLGYLAAIARNFLLNERRVREESVPAEALEAAMMAGVGTGMALASAPRRPDELAEERELTRLVEGFLARRTQPERDVFTARFVDRRTQDDSASAVGLSRIQVRRIEAHLREDLLTLFKQSGYLERTVAKPSSLLGVRETQGADP